VLESSEVTSVSYVCNGTDGDAGLAALVAQAPEPPGANCADGGTQIQSGLDANGDGQLESTEVTSTSYVCNGPPGEGGTAPPRELTSFVTLTPSLTCPWGATETEVGFDTNGNGTLDANEVQHTSVVCSLKIIDAALGDSHTCAAFSDGTVDCWGLNASGQLGDGTTTSSSTPVTVGGLTGGTGATALAAGSAHTCALMSNGTVECWGADQHGQLGYSIVSGKVPAPTSSPTPGPVVSGGVVVTGVTAIAAGSAHTCGLMSDGTVECWGLNGSGQLGNGTTTNSTTPVAVAGLSGAKAIGAAGATACAVLSNGTVKCWGDNTSGQLGNGTTTSSSTPVTVLVGSGNQALPSVSAIAVGGDHTCATRLSPSSTYCWGANTSGAFGNGTTTDQLRAFPVGTGLALGAGTGYTCERHPNPVVTCSGLNDQGQLGNGTTSDALQWVNVSGLTGVTEIAVGTAHACALVAGGTGLECWGDNQYGQIGDGTSGGPISTPVVVK
ncbi:MAG: RCC1 domain-containing protein, partial [Acidimicrobiales bacterium]